MQDRRSTTYVAEVTATDPDTGAQVELEIHKDPQSGALFAVEAEYLEQVQGWVHSPYNAGEVLWAEDPNEDDLAPGL